MITEKEYRALRYANHDWYSDLAEFPKGIGKGIIAGLFEQDFLEYGSHPQWGGPGYRTTDLGKAAKQEYFDRFGEVLKD
jgi:hypothetical protein